VSYAHGCDRRVPGAQLPSAPGGRYSAGCCGAAVKELPRYERAILWAPQECKQRQSLCEKK